MDRHPFRPLRIAAIAIVALAVSLATISPASSAVDSTASVSADARLANGGRVNTQSAADKVARYWTKDRMLSAIDLTDTPAAGTVTRQAVRPTGKPGTSPAAAAVDEAAVRFARGNDMSVDAVMNSITVGKVFFTNPVDGLDYGCSASALNSNSKQLVITAGHCVHVGDGNADNWMTNWTFVPGYADGDRPFGTFAAKQFRTFDAWINSGDFLRDVGLTTTHPLDGRKLVDVVGGMGLSWNFPQDVPIMFIGYPSNFNDGELQEGCSGTTRAVSDGRIEIECNFQPGFSGGPWLRNFDAATGRGSVNGIGSTITSTGWNRSGYFDTAVKTMVDAQGGVT